MVVCMTTVLWISRVVNFKLNVCHLFPTQTDVYEVAIFLENYIHYLEKLNRLSVACGIRRPRYHKN